MSSGATPLKKSLGAYLEGHGFSRKGDTWYRRSSEVILLVDLQKSQYGHQYYMNFGVWLNAAGQMTWPQEHLCHIRFRLGMVTPEPELAARLLDLEVDALVLEEHLRQLEGVLNQIMPFFLSLESLSGIKTAVARGQLKDVLINRKATEVLGLNR